MEEKIPQDRATDKWNGLKQAMVSILIGAAISFLTVLFQYTIGILQDIPAELPGSLVGMVRYITKWTSNHYV